MYNFIYVFLVPAAIGSLQSYVFLASEGVYGFLTIHQLLYHHPQELRKLFQERMHVSIRKSLIVCMQFAISLLYQNPPAILTQIYCKD
jgi:hypothetical protein